MGSTWRRSLPRVLHVGVVSLRHHTGTQKDMQKLHQDAC
jgi:hypothetical protein